MIRASELGLNPSQIFFYTGDSNCSSKERILNGQTDRQCIVPQDHHGHHTPSSRIIHERLATMMTDFQHANDGRFPISYFLINKIIGPVIRDLTIDAIQGIDIDVYCLQAPGGDPIFILEIFPRFSRGRPAGAVASKIRLIGRGSRLQGLDLTPVQEWFSRSIKNGNTYLLRRYEDIQLLLDITCTAILRSCCRQEDFSEDMHDISIYPTTAVTQIIVTKIWQSLNRVVLIDPLLS